ncbi:MAG: hypothetical protein VB913_05130 [Rhodospirillales bacterium]
MPWDWFCFWALPAAVKNTFTLLYDQSEQLIDSLVNTIDQELKPIQRQAEFVTRQVRNGNVDPRKNDSWLRFIEAVPAAKPQVISLGFISRNYEATIYAVRPAELFHRDFSRFKEVREIVDGVKGPMRPQWYRPDITVKI